MMRTKHTPGPWRLATDAQGPCMIMHPTKEGVAIASASNVFAPTQGFHDPTVEKPESCPDAYGGTTYRPERVANIRLMAAAPDLLLNLKLVCMLAERLGPKAHNTHREEALAMLDGTIKEARAVIADAEGA